MIQTFYNSEVRVLPLRPDGSIDPNAKSTIWPVKSMEINWGRQHKDPTTRRRVRPVGVRPTGYYVLRDGFENIGFDIDLGAVSSELFALLCGYAELTGQATMTTRAAESLGSMLRREPWLIRLGQRLCGAR